MRLPSAPAPLRALPPCPPGSGSPGSCSRASVDGLFAAVARLTPVLPAGRVHLPLARAQPRGARPAADPRRRRPLPRAARSDRDRAGLARHRTTRSPPSGSRRAFTRSSSRSPRFPPTCICRRLGLSTLARHRRRRARPSRCRTASTASTMLADPLAYPLVLSAVYAGICVVSRTRRCAHSSLSQPSARSRSSHGSSTSWSHSPCSAPSSSPTAATSSGPCAASGSRSLC